VIEAPPEGQKVYLVTKQEPSAFFSFESPAIYGGMIELKLRSLRGEME